MQIVHKSYSGEIITFYLTYDISDIDKREEKEYIVVDNEIDYTTMKTVIVYNHLLLILLILSWVFNPNIISPEDTDGIEELNTTEI